MVSYLYLISLPLISTLIFLQYNLSGFWFIVLLGLLFFFLKGIVFGAMLSYVALTEVEIIMSTSTGALLTWTSLATSHLGKFNICVSNLAAPSAQLLPSISFPLDPLSGFNYCLWMLEMMVVRLRALSLVWGCSHGPGVDYTGTRNKNLVLDVQLGNSNQREEVCWKTWSSVICKTVANK